MKFLLDTNFLMIPGKFRVDVFYELTKFGRPECYTLDLVIEELERIASRRGRNLGYAKLALFLVKEKSVKILKSKEGKADEEILKRAGDFVVCTSDRILIRKLKEKGGRIVILKSRKYLEEA